MAPPQEAYFYDSCWTADIEARVVNELVRQKENGVWVIGADDNHMAIENVRTIVNDAFSKEYGVDWYNAHVDMLGARYDTVKFLWDHTPGAFNWDRNVNKFLAPAETWQRFEKMNPFTVFYRDDGEPYYRELATLFECGVSDVGTSEYIFYPFPSSDGESD